MPVVGTPPGFPGPQPGTLPLAGQDLTPVVSTVSPNGGLVAGGTAITITGANFRTNNDGSAPDVLLGLNSPQLGVLADAPVGYWRLGDPLGTPVVADLGTKNNPGTVTGGITLGQQGVFGNGTTAALDDGTSGYVSVPDTVDHQFLGAFSVEAWVKIANATGFGFIVSKSAGGTNGYELFRQTGVSQFRFSAWPPNFDITTTGGAFGDGLWHHVVGVYDPTTAKNAKIYVDGVLNVTSATFTGAVAANAGPLIIGGRGNGGTLNFNGTIGEVAVYKVALSAAQVLAHYRLKAIPATAVVVASPTSITATTGASPLIATTLTNVSVTIAARTGTLPLSYTYFIGKILSVTPAFGVLAGGTAVIIKGFNFVTGSTIAFGANAATLVTFHDSNTYSCTTPSNAVGFVDVKITEPGGTSYTLRNGFQYTNLIRGNDIRRMPSITIREVMNNTPNICTFSIDGKSNQPVTGEYVTIVDGQDANRLLFAGTIQSFEQVYEGLTTNLVWRCTALDFTWLLNKRRPFGSYVNVRANDIVKDLIAKFAPGFNSTFVQTNLAAITATFDGTQDFTTCLNAIASAIGGGHWYVDYTQGVHFFHIVPPNVIPPVNPNQPLTAGAAAMTVAEAGLIPSTFNYSPGYYAFYSTFLYDNNVESQLSLLSNFVVLRGDRIISFSNIPIGATLGGHVVTKRQIYAKAFGTGDGSITAFCQITDNTTTAFTTWFKATGASVAAVTASSVAFGNPLRIYVAPPAGPSTQPTASQGVGLLYFEPNPPFNDPINFRRAATYTAGVYVFKVTTIYQDGTESLPSPESAPATLDGVKLAHLTNIPLGVTLGTLGVLGRCVYGSYLSGSQGTYPDDWAPSHTWSWAFIPDNTTVDVDLAGPGFITRFNDAGVPPGGTAPAVWPNPDGPSLEIYPAPDALDSSNTTLLYDPKITMTTDLSQVRNRIYVRGAGSTTVNAAVVGATQLTVADLAVFSPSGGKVHANGNVLNYLGISGPSGAGVLFLKPDSTLTVAIPQGAPVDNWMQIDDVASQTFLGKIELDANGVVTDGVHEYMVADTTLRTQFQLYIRGYAELELFSRPIVTISYATRDKKTRLGQNVVVNLTNPPIQGTFLIQDITIDQIHDVSDYASPRYLVKATSVKFNLTDLLLQILAGAPIGTSSGGGGSLVGVIPASAPPGAVPVFQTTFRLGGSAAQTLNSLPLEVIPAQGAGKMIVILEAVLYLNQSVALLNSRGANLFYDSAGPPLTLDTQIIGTFNTFQSTSALNERIVLATLFPPAEVNWALSSFDPTNKGVAFKMQTGDNAAGFDPAFANYYNLHLTYTVLTVVKT